MFVPNYLARAPMHGCEDSLSRACFAFCRKQSPVNQLISVRLKEMAVDVLSVIRIPTFQIIILQASVLQLSYKQPQNGSWFVIRLPVLEVR